ncbi:DUF4369 domain-containing protein [Flavobacteriaceae bacterium F89]|uniref:DUF4369 domain-containing protein n=1 Tax=Cerina litoralis TaxID=2874477 RepID=A0AAE3EVP2_9FLAO|nr:DUF4369 domain-containing protein [Cerina litoralis]MCG2460507.1 DUF4369 domain-containing protein [Cerina litoralis]
MKNLLLIGLTIGLLVSCNRETKKTMTVTGNVKGLKKGTLFLQHIPDSVLVNVDSLKIEGDGNFTFKTELESPEIFYLYLIKKDNNDINDRITFFGEPGTITINTSWNTFDIGADIEGSKSQKKLEEYNQVISKFSKKSLDYMQALYDPKFRSDSLAIDSIKKLSDQNAVREYLYSLNFVINNPDSYVAPYVALRNIESTNVRFLDSIYKKLTPAVAESKYGKALKKYMEDEEPAK